MCRILDVYLVWYPDFSMPYPTTTKRGELQKLLSCFTFIFRHQFHKIETYLIFFQQQKIWANTVDKEFSYIYPKHFYLALRTLWVGLEIRNSGSYPSIANKAVVDPKWVFPDPTFRIIPDRLLDPDPELSVVAKISTRTSATIMKFHRCHTFQ